MRLVSPIRAGDLANSIGAEVIGDPDRMIYGINEIHKVEEGDLTFVDVEKYFANSLSSAASVILLHKPTDCPDGKTLLVVEHPFRHYNDLIDQYRDKRPISVSIDPEASIHPSTVLEPGCVIGPGVTIGPDCHIQANVYIGAQANIGARVTIDASTVIGSNGFYFKNHGTHREAWHSGGSVVIKDDVYIGALCTINRGISGNTVIGNGSKLDCQVHLGHGVVVGDHCLIAGQVGIGGKTIIGDHVTILGQVGINNAIKIGDHAVILGQTGVTKDIAGGKTYFGTPVAEAKEKYKELVALRKLAKSP